MGVHRAFDKRHRVGYLGCTMSLRSALRPMQHVPAETGHRSFGAGKRMLADTNAGRGYTGPTGAFV